MGWGRELNGNNIQFQCLPVDVAFMDLMGIKVNEGRGFRKSDELASTGCYVFNERARSMYNIRLGDKIYGDEVVGFMPDVKFATFRTEVTPMAFYFWGNKPEMEENLSYAYIKVKPCRR